MNLVCPWNEISKTHQSHHFARDNQLCISDLAFVHLITTTAIDSTYDYFHIPSLITSGLWGQRHQQRCSGCTFPGFTQKLELDRSKAVVSRSNRPKPLRKLKTPHSCIPTDTITYDLMNRKDISADFIRISTCRFNYKLDRTRSIRTIGTRKDIK